jgi:uncharacterized protein (TIGR00730 family)
LHAGARMHLMKRVCVFCGASPGNDPVYRQAAEALGALLARQGLVLVYGGGNVGLMGTVADAVLSAGGGVIGVIPGFLQSREVAHVGLSELHVVDSMHERKARMAELSDAFLVLPGGFGTFEEFFEILTWSQLGLHQKPIAFVNVKGYYDLLIRFLDSAVQAGFVSPAARALVIESRDPARALAQLRSFEPPQVVRWVDDLPQT